jgi:protein tyrosine phosphatase (PTP) superfamily phosphohydrolase (DUF442 family)
MGHHFRFVILATALCVNADVCPLSHTSSAHTKQSRPNKSLRDNLPNFGEATTTLYHGGQPSREGFRMLAKMGVRIVVDLRGERESERKIVTSLGMQYIGMPWECSFPADERVAKFLSLLRNNPGKKVFVHCKLGDDRTAMMIAAYRMAEQGWSPKRAEKEMEKYGFNFVHRNLICPGLSHYEKNFPHRFKTSPDFQALR